MQGWTMDVLGGGSDRRSRSTHLLLVRQEDFSFRAHISSWNALSCSSLAASILKIALVLLLPLQHLVAHILQLFVKGLHLLGARGEEGDPGLPPRS